MPPRQGVYGLLAEFNTPGELVQATKSAYAAGYRRMETYTPYPPRQCMFIRRGCRWCAWWVG
jgi:hypothetical protein